MAMESVEFNNGVKMPILGYGVYKIADLKECERCVLDAIDVGYRSIDTAQMYGNEEGVGNAVRKSGIPRDEIFITTKIWITNGGYEQAKASIERSLKKLQIDYADLILVHQPFNDYYGTYRAMEESYDEGKVRAIGVSNFYPDRLVDICHFVDVVPAVNQIETHVFQQQKPARKFMKKYGVRHESWGPLTQGRKDFFTNPVLNEIGKEHGKTVAQVALRFLIQNDIAVIPKTTHRERMEQNFDVFDFKLNIKEMAAIEKLDEGKSSMSHYDPVTVERLIAR